jgi:heme exporter protein D
MKWDSWTDFWAMGGYALYVWGSVGVTFVALLIEVWLARVAHRSVLLQLRAQHFLQNMSDEDEA